jgi:hypothetical protein
MVANLWSFRVAAATASLFVFIITPLGMIEIGAHRNATTRTPNFSKWQRFAGLLRHHVLGVPVGPVLVALASVALLMLAVG